MDINLIMPYRGRNDSSFFSLFYDDDGILTALECGEREVGVLDPCFISHYEVVVSEHWTVW